MKEEEDVQRMFLDWLERENRTLDELVRLRVKHTLPVVTPTCSGCTSPGCCSQKVISPFQEALPIARDLRRRGLDTPELRARLRAEGDQMDQTSRLAWHRADRKCLFLEDGKCSIYQNRPFACRTYLVLTPSALCQPNAVNQKVECLDFSDELGQLMNRSGEINRMMGLRESRKRIFIGPLPRLVAIALEAWEMPPRAAADYITRQKWPTDDDINADWIDGEMGAVE